MVGARFRRNKAKPCRGLLIRATGWHRRRGICGRSGGGCRGTLGVVTSRVRLTPWRRGAVDGAANTAVGGAGVVGTRAADVAAGWRLGRQGPHRAWLGPRRCGCCGRVVQWGAAVPLAPSCASVLWAAGARSVWRCAGWQDSRVVRDLRGPCSEKGPFLARSSRYAFPKGDLRGFSDTWRANLAKASSFRMHGGDMLP